MKGLFSFLILLATTAPAQERVVTKISTGKVSAYVDTNDAPDLKEWGAGAGTRCVDWFSKIAALLPSEGYVAPTDVTLVFDPKMSGVAHAAGGKITISAAYVRGHPDDHGMVIHELTHVVQAYPPGGPGWLVEGIADYIRIVHFEPQAPRPKVTRLSSYREGYKTTAIFLEWVERNRGPGLVVKLNAALRAGTYHEDLWVKITGRTLEECWAEFAKTLGE